MKKSIFAYIITEISVILLALVITTATLPKSSASENVVLAVDSRCLDESAHYVSASFNGLETQKMEIDTSDYVSTPQLSDEETTSIRSLKVSSIDINVYDKQSNLIDTFENIKVDKYNPFKYITTIYIYQDENSIFYEYNQFIILLAVFILSSILFVIISLIINLSKRTRLK